MGARERGGANGESAQLLHLKKKKQKQNAYRHFELEGRSLSSFSVLSFVHRRYVLC